MVTLRKCDKLTIYRRAVAPLCAFGDGNDKAYVVYNQNDDVVIAPCRNSQEGNIHGLG